MTRIKTWAACPNRDSYILFILPLSALTGAFWVAYELPGLVAFTISLAGFCQSFFVRCVEYLDILKLMFFWAGATVVSGGMVYGLVRAANNYIKGGRAVKKLPVALSGSVALIRDDYLKAAFTYGLIRPRIYISTGLIKGLDRSELTGVFLHELHHKKRRDPLRFFLMAFLNDAFFYLPLFACVVGNIRRRKEHEADDAAVSSMTEPVSLAGALVKIASSNMDLASIASISGGEVQDRVRRLIDGRGVTAVSPPQALSKEGLTAGFARPDIKTVFVTLLAAAALAASFAAPLNASFTGKKQCSTGHCERHADKLGAECRKHCETRSHKH